MSSKTVSNRLIKLSENQALSASIALYAYADAAYPPGGSECAQASNQTLKDIAAKVGRSHEQPFKVKKRQLPTIKAALKWYFNEQEGQGDANSVNLEQILTLFSNP